MSESSPQPRQPKTKEQLLEEEVQKQLIRAEAAKDSRVVEAIERQEQVKQAARARMQRQLAQQQLRMPEGLPGAKPFRPFQKVLEETGVTVSEKKAGKNRMAAAHSEHAQTLQEARQSTLETASVAAEMLNPRVDPNVAMVVNTGSTTTKHFKAPHTYRRKVMRGGQQVNEEVTKNQYFGERTTEHYGVAGYGWEIPMGREFNEPGARLVLCTDGSIMTLRANERPASSINDMQFNPGFEVTDRKYLARQAQGQPDKIVLVTHVQGLSRLTEDQSSDIAAKPLPVNNPEGAAQMAMRREMLIQEGIAQLLVSNGMTE